MSITNERIIEALQHEAAQLRGELATACAALEQAETFLAAAELARDEYREELHQRTCKQADCELAWREVEASRQATQAMLQQAERERDTALARMKEAQLQAIDQQSRRCAAETALASALARVKELEASNRALLMTNRVEEADADDQRERRRAAESALASARELLAQWLRSFPHLRSARLGVRTEEWLTSHPVPVAEPLSGEQLAERYGFKPHGRWVVGCDFGAGDAPVAAPCATCGHDTCEC